METKMEELKMYHSTLGKGRHGKKSASNFTIYYHIIYYISNNLVYHAGSLALSNFPELVQLSPTNEVICLYQMCSKQNTTQQFEYVFPSYKVFIPGLL